MSEKLTITLYNGRRIEVPEMTVDHPGHGARTEDTHCVRCGEEADLTHRVDIASCTGKCHVCKLEDHPGEVCPQLVARVDRWWWRLRGFTGGIPGVIFPPPAMTKPHPSLLVAPPEIMLQVLKQDMNAEDHAKLTETLQSIQQLQNTSRLILSSVASLVPSPADPTGILERNITFASPELVNASETIKQQATRMNQLLTRRLQNKMREVIKSAEEAVSQQVAIPMPAASRPAAFGGVMEELTRKFQRSFGQASTPAPTPVTSQPAEDDDDYPDTDPMEWEDASPSPSPPPRRKVRFAPPPEPSVKAEEQSSSSLSGVMPGQEQVGAVGRSPPEVWVAPGFFFAASGQVQMSRKPPTPPRSASPEEHDPLLKYPKRLLGEYHDRPEVKRRR